MFLGFVLNSAFSDDDRSGQNNTTISPQCQSFISWFSNREQDLLNRLNSDKKHERYGAAEEILEHPQTHAQQVVSKALDVAYEGKLYETIKGTSTIVTQKIDDDSSIFNKFSNACNASATPSAYKFELSLRIEAAITLGQLAHYIVLNNRDNSSERCNDGDDNNEEGSSHYLHKIIKTFEYCLDSSQPDLLQAACAESSGNTYNKALEPVLQSIINNPNNNSLTALASARSLSQIESFTQSTPQTKAKIALSNQDPPSYITNEMLNNAMGYIKQLIPNTY